ncbi:unnamed protein product [Coregonus sp. 'balchen']|nr:unnamed protein product [Coregonus sp. 'balchen']
MNGLQSSPPGWPGSVCSIEGLPALPKGLSGILNSSGGSWRDIEKVHSKRTSLQADISKSSVIDSLGRSKPARLDATLRKEMDYYEEEEGNYGDNVPQDLPGTSLTLQPTQNSRDQLIKESFHIPL